MDNNFEDILLELSYRSPDGIINLSEQSQVDELINILRENNFDNPNEIAQKARVYFSYLTEQKTYKAINKSTGRVSVFKSKEAQAAAVKSGTHSLEKPKKTNNTNKKTSQSQKLSPSDFLSGKEKEKKTNKSTSHKFKPLRDNDTVIVDGEKKTVVQARKIDDNKVLVALKKTKKEAAADALAAAKSGEKLGIGAGSPASRAGECAVVFGAKTIKQLMDGGSDYKKARTLVEKKLRSFVSDERNLTKEWVDAGMNTLDYIENTIGFKKIKEYTWDTPEGRAICGTDEHGTSSDTFVLLKDGTRIGISLKKDLNVFVFNGGMAQMLGTLKENGLELSDNSTITHYNQRREQEFRKLAKVITKSPAIQKAFCAQFDIVKKKPQQIFGKAAPKRIGQIINSVYEKGERPNNLKDVNCKDVIINVVNGPRNGANMVILADMAKTSDNTKIRAGYNSLRSLDDEMTTAIKEDFMKPENRKAVIGLVKKETHIDDILFPNNEKLDELKVIYGEQPAIEMQKQKIIELFGIDKLHQAFLSEKDSSKKEKLKKSINKIINSKIQINDKNGVMSIGLDVGSDNIVPVFEARVRTRGIGKSPTFEMAQSRFGGLAFKYGTTNFNKWDDKDRHDAVTSMANDLYLDLENLDLSSKKTKAEVLNRMARLNKILPESSNKKNRSFSKLKKKLNINSI